MILIWFKNSDR